MQLDIRDGRGPFDDIETCGRDDCTECDPNTEVDEDRLETSPEVLICDDCGTYATVLSSRTVGKPFDASIILKMSCGHYNV